jgi:hypothetical protein
MSGPLHPAGPAEALLYEMARLTSAAGNFAVAVAAHAGQEVTSPPAAREVMADLARLQQHLDVMRVGLVPRPLLAEYDEGAA